MGWNAGSTLREKGVLGFDMETSAIFSVAIYRRVMAGCILVASTNLMHGRSLGFFAPYLRKSIQEAVKISIYAIEALKAAEAGNDSFRPG